MTKTEAQLWIAIFGGAVPSRSVTDAVDMAEGVLRGLRGVDPEMVADLEQALNGAAPPESPPTLPLRADEWELKWTAGSAPDGWERSGAWLVAVSGDNCPCLWARRRKVTP